MLNNYYLDKLHEQVELIIRELTQKVSGKNHKHLKDPSVNDLLKVALKNEWETANLSAKWATTETSVEFAMELTRLAGDEAKHFFAILNLLKARGETLPSYSELNQKSALYDYLIQQESSFDRTVCGPYVREYLAVARNLVFIEYCGTVNDLEVIEIYQEIQKDEFHHHELGKRRLAELLKTENDYHYALKKVRETLKVVDDVQEMVMLKKGLCKLPGC